MTDNGQGNGQGNGLAVKVQTWGDDLRLPCFINPAETTGLISELEPLRRPSLPFQSKHLPALKRNKWFVLRRPKARSGLVVIWPDQKCCIYISGEPLNQKRPTPRVALLRIRIDPQFLTAGTGLTVFGATLMPESRRLAIEDTFIWKGRNVLSDEPFSKRWALAVQWIEHYCLMDPRLLSGIEIEMAKWGSLNTMQPDSVWELQQDEPGRHRYLWMSSGGTIPVASISPLPPAVAPTLEVGPLVANATRDAGPEQWQLATGDGVSLGRALIRTLAVSERLRSSKSTKLRVEVGWNAVFSKWEIKGLTESLATSGIANFEGVK